MFRDRSGEEEPQGTTRNEEPRQNGRGTAAGHDLRIVAAAALGFLEVGDVEGAKDVLRDALAPLATNARGR
jgi:hypothetical protein